MKNYEQRKCEKCGKFAEDNGLEYKTVMDLVLWVEWAGGRKIVNEIIENLKSRKI